MEYEISVKITVVTRDSHVVSDGGMVFFAREHGETYFARLSSRRDSLAEKLEI